MRKLGHGGKPVVVLTPGRTGRMRLDGMPFEKAIDSVGVPLGSVSLNAQIGCVPLGAAIVTLMREPAR